MHRLRAIALASALSFGFVGIGMDVASAQKEKSAGKGGYAACKAKLSKEPPCSSNWTRACAAQCGSKF